MKDPQKHLAWLFFAYGIIEIVDWISLFSVLWFPNLAGVIASSMGITREVLQLKVGVLLYLVGFLVVNSLYMRNYLLRNPHLAKVPVGVTYSIIAMVGYGWLWILQGAVFGEPVIAFVAGGLHLVFALVIGYVAEQMPRHESEANHGMNVPLPGKVSKAKRKR